MNLKPMRGIEKNYGFFWEIWMDPSRKRWFDRPPPPGNGGLTDPPPSRKRWSCSLTTVSGRGGSVKPPFPGGGGSVKPPFPGGKGGLSNHQRREGMFIKDVKHVHQRREGPCNLT